MPDAQDYLNQMLALLPQGAAWPREGETTLKALLSGLAEEFARVDGRGRQLMIESDPRQTVEMLPNWERAFGLPDGCVVADPTVEGRQLSLHQRVASLGGQSEAYFVELSALLGHDTEIQTWRPSRLPFSLDRPLASVSWAFAWRVLVYGAIDMDGPPSYASADLECVIHRSSPAHTVVSFDWEPDPEPTLHFDFLNPGA